MWIINTKHFSVPDQEFSNCDVYSLQHFAEGIFQKVLFSNFSNRIPSDLLSRIKIMRQLAINNLTKEEAASFLRCSTRTLDYKVSRGEITPVRIGKKVFFRNEDLERLMVTDQKPVVNNV
jgi:excisionase family DNA binding protein